MYAPPNEMFDANMKQGENARIFCIDEDGVVWSLTEDSQVGDWLRYAEAEGEILAYDEVKLDTWNSSPEVKQT